MDMPNAILSKDYQKEMPPYLPLVAEGKTRLIYRIPDSTSEQYPWGLLLFVAKDDVSTHNVVHKTPLPWKGYALTAFTVYGFTQVIQNVPNHLVAHGHNIYGHLLGNSNDYPRDLWKRAIVVEQLMMAPIEDVRRENLCGSLYKGPYARGEDPYGLDLQPGLPMMHPFKSTIYTPTAKSKKDEPLHGLLTAQQFPDLFKLGAETWVLLRSFFTSRGFHLADGKDEMGWRLYNGVLQPVIGDEPAIGPDNIRIARIDDVRDAVKNGVEPTWHGKENVRQVAEQMWDGGEQAPLTFSPDIAEKHGREDYYDVVEEVLSTSLENLWDRMF